MKERKKDGIKIQQKKRCTPLANKKTVCLPRSGSDYSVVPLLTACVCEKSIAVVLGNSLIGIAMLHPLAPS